MEKLSLLSPIFLAVCLAMTVVAQTPPTPLDDFIDNSETIVVASCVRAAAVDILGRSTVDLAVLYVVKGDPKLTTLSLKLRYRMDPGRQYLVRIATLNSGKRALPPTEERETVIPIWEGEKLDELRSLPTRIVVLRTINLRIDDLESVIRQSNFELEPLKSLKRGN
jgi:hypothetical protein